MTTPIPEAAVEAALAAYATAINAPTVEWIGTDATEGVKAALTAARPLMEGEMLNEFVGNIPSDPAFAPDFDMGDYARGYQLRTREVNAIIRDRAATIAERTQR